jgi:hypothetical protein
VTWREVCSADSRRQDSPGYDRQLLLRDGCPLCGSSHEKVIYAGLPLKLCVKKDCNCVWGFWSRLFYLLPFNGVFMKYHGSYWRALWHWLTAEEET